MKRVYNFSPGPSALPLEVLKKAAKEMCDANGTGQSVMEMSHRSKDYKPIIEKTEALLRELMAIPANYKVLFLQGGASLQFAMIPMNLAAGANPSEGKKVAIIETGIWAEKAAKEASKIAKVEVRASSKDRGYTYIPEVPAAQPDDAYYHITMNNTIVGTKWAKLPDTGNVPLVADMSSCILSEPIDVSHFGIIYAGAQKNLGPAGATVVIIRDDLIGKAPGWVPSMLNYESHVKEGSMYNTPPCYSIYMIGLVLEWLKKQGGAAGIGNINQEKAALFYNYLDASKLYHAPVEKPYRSIMNIPFVMKIEDTAKREELEKRFVKEAAAAGLVNLAGHRLVGGMRASMYNAMPIKGVQALIQFMQKFEKGV